MGKKPSKQKSSAKAQHITAAEYIASKMVYLSDGHAIRNLTSMQARCGFLGSGWHFGSKEEIACAKCVEAQ